MLQSKKDVIRKYYCEISVGISYFLLLYLLKLKLSIEIRSNSLIFLIDIILTLFLLFYIVIIPIPLLKRIYPSNKRKKTKSSDMRIIIKGYFFVLISITITGGYILFKNLNSSINFLGAWLFVFEIALGIAAASQMNILTSISTVKAKGMPITESTIIQQRLKDEEEAIRSPWFIALAINTIFLFAIST